MRYIEIDKEEIPYTFEINLANETMQIGINYNEIGDFFTVDLFKNERPVLLGQKIIYGRDIFGGYIDKDLPKVSIIPYDTTEEAKKVGYNDLENNVFLFLVGDNYVD